MDIKQLFQDIASNSGVSGYEDQVADQIKEHAPGLMSSAVIHLET